MNSKHFWMATILLLGHFEQINFINSKTLKKIFVFVFVIACSCQSFAQETYSVKTKAPGIPIAPTLWGLFFEDINRAADGGMYAELVKNRSFDFPKPMMGWETWPNKRLRDGIFVVTTQVTENVANPRYMAVSLQERDTVGLSNAGFDEGMGFKKGLPYLFTLSYRNNISGTHIQLSLFNSQHQVIARSVVPIEDSKFGWQEVHCKITPTDSARAGKLLVIFEGACQMDVDRISLFPSDTWKNRPGGLRADLVQALADLKPGFLRFPGGCIVEGKNLSFRYKWKNTIGPIENRKLVQSIWNDDVPNRQTPDYFESNGLGFFEYFQLCEDIGASPLPILNCGMSCQFDAAEVVPLNELDPYVQDALDLIEFANGSIQTKWGAVRAKLGHPASFNMKMLGVGNENWGPQYSNRLEVFTKAIKAKYPAIQLVNATGYGGGERFSYMDSLLRVRHADIIDEHFYSKPEWFFANSNRYDHYDRKGPKIFVGEYAAQSIGIGSPENKNNLLSALSEAAFMTGIERNADVVSMASYAPLFAHVTGWQWTPDLIWFDNIRSYKTPNYHVQQLFSLNRGTNVVPLTLAGKAIQGQDSIWASAVIDENTKELIVKMVNASSETKHKIITMDGGSDASTGTQTILTGNLTDVNSLEAPGFIQPKTIAVKCQNKTLTLDLPAYSFSVVRLKL